MSNFDLGDFRRALGQFPTGVTVITTLDPEGKPVGMTASSFNSVSMDPPLILWSIDRGAHSASIFKNTDYFAVNVLSKDQADTSNRFAGRGEDKFKDVTFSAGAGGCPLLEDCSAQFECKAWNVYEGGDHLIVVGEVVRYTYEASPPLVFSQGSYAVSMQHPGGMKQADVDLAPDGFLTDYLPYLLHAAFVKSGSELYAKLKSAFDLTPEEWRVFTLLSDNGVTSEAELADRVMQPEGLFALTAKAMIGKNYIKRETDNRLALTDVGRELGLKLFSIAKQHEVDVLKSLTEVEREALKHSLRQIA